MPPILKNNNKLVNSKEEKLHIGVGPS